MSCFKAKIYLPYIKEYTQIKQFNNKTYKNLIKYINNKNTELLNVFIDDILTEHCSATIKELCIIDKFIILLNLRCISVGDTLTHTIEKDKVKHNLNYNIYDIIKNISDTCNFKFDKTITYKEYQIKTGIPKKLFITINELENFIDELRINGNKIKVHLLDELQANQIVNLLPGQFLHELYREMQNIASNINKVVITNFKTNLDSTEIQTLYMHLDKDNMFKIFEIFFNELFLNFYIKQFILSKEYNISCEYFDSLPPIESDIFFNFHKDIDEKQNKAANNNNMNIPLPPHGDNLG